MAERAPVFELHIKPMFRLLDRQHMLRVKHDLDLWDYESAKTFGPRILQKVGGPNPTMPTQDTGGPWPSEWVGLFNRWVQGGFRRLSLATAKSLKLADQGGGRFMLSCKADVPATNDDDSFAWFEPELLPGSTTVAYRLCLLPGEDLSAPPATVETQCQERVDGPIPPDGITVIDAAGTHKVTFPSA
jgi:hypothetical protein